MVQRRSFALLLMLALLVPILVACGGGTATTPTESGAPATSAETGASAGGEASVAASAEASEATEPSAAASAEASEAGEASAEASEAGEASAEASEAGEASAAASGDAEASAAASGDAETSAAASSAGGTVDYARIGPELAAAFDGEYEGTSVSLVHGLSGDEEALFQSTFAPFTEATGITVNLVPGGTVETTAVKVESGTIEDIVNFPQPGTMAGYAAQGKLIDLNEVINPEWLQENYNQGFIDTLTVPGADGEPILGGVFERINFKSAVWYPKAAFEEAGYTVPETWDEMIELSDTIVADGDTPWCIGIESGGATGWPATDWLEEIMLRTTSLENYDAWTKGELEFTSPEVRAAMDRLTEIWFNDEYVYGGRQAIASTNFGDAPTPMLQDPPNCWMHRQGNFITSFFEENVPGVEAGVDYDFFYLPPIDPQYGSPVLYAGDLFGMFNDRPEVRALMQYFTTYEAIQPWIQNGQGALSPHNNAVLDDYQSDIDRAMAETILSADSVRFDGSDLMPAEVGSGSFWKGMTDYVSGSADLDQALETIQGGWANVQQ